MSAIASSDNQSKELRPASSIFEHDLRLLDLVRILIRRRKLIAGVWLLTVALTAVFLWFTPTIYESRSVIRIGRVEGVLTSQAVALVRDLQEEFEVDDLDRDWPLLSWVTAEGDDVLFLTAEAESAAEAQSYLAQIVGSILERQAQPYEAGRRMLEGALVVLEGQIDKLNEQLDGLSGLISAVHNDEAAKSLLILHSTSLQASLPSLHAQRVALQQQLLSTRTYPTRVIRNATLPKKAKAPQKPLIAAFALVFGLLVGAVVALALEFLQRARLQLRADN